MQKTCEVCESEEWNLELAGITDAPPAASLEHLSRAVIESGGWVLGRSVVSAQCAEIDFEFPRLCTVGMYGLVLASGLELTADSHAQLGALWHCTAGATEEVRDLPARLHLCLYSREGSAAFLSETMRRAAPAA